MGRDQKTPTKQGSLTIAVHEELAQTILMQMGWDRDLPTFDTFLGLGERVFTCGEIKNLSPEVACLDQEDLTPFYMLGASYAMNTRPTLPSQNLWRTGLLGAL